MIGDFSPLENLLAHFPGVIDLTLRDAISNSNIRYLSEHPNIQHLCISELKPVDLYRRRPQKGTIWLPQFPNLRTLQFDTSGDPLHKKLVENCLPSLVINTDQSEFHCPRLGAIHFYPLSVDQQFQTTMEKFLDDRRKGGHPVSYASFKSPRS
jgi:hypothetical protein